MDFGCYLKCTSVMVGGCASDALLWMRSWNNGSAFGRGLEDLSSNTKQDVVSWALNPSGIFLGCIALKYLPFPSYIGPTKMPLNIEIFTDSYLWAGFLWQLHPLWLSGRHESHFLLLLPCKRFMWNGFPEMLWV